MTPPPLTQTPFLPSPPPALQLLIRKLRHLQHVREGGNIREMMFTLRSDLIRNVANIAKRWAGFWRFSEAVWQFVARPFILSFGV